MKKIKKNYKRKGLTRRDFLKYTAGTGMMMGMPSLHAFAGLKGDNHSKKTEKRTYYFDLSHSDMDADHYMIAGIESHKLKKVTPKVLKMARTGNNFLNFVPDHAVTHYASKIRLPADAIQLCYVKCKHNGDTDASWDMPLMFYHLPRKDVKKSWKRKPAGESYTHAKLEFYGIDSELIGNSANVSLQMDNFKAVTETATGLVFNHPELICGDTVASVHIQNNIISAQPKTNVLSIMLKAQGSDWATKKPIIDPTTGEPYKNSMGEDQFIFQPSDTTLKYMGDAIHPSLKQAKDDTSLGVNITEMSSDVINPELQGKIWKIRDGVPTRQADTGNTLGYEDSFSYAFSSLSPHFEYKASISSVDSTTREVKILLENSWLRYLGVYIRYIDAGGDPIPWDDLPDDTKAKFPDWGRKYSSDIDQALALLAPEFNILGFPIESTKQEFTISVPETAANVLVLSGGLGYGSKTYPHTIDIGETFTIVTCLVIPCIFLTLTAASAYAFFIGSFEEMAVGPLIAEILEICAEMDLAHFCFDSPMDWLAAGEKVAEGFLGTTAPYIVGAILQATGSSKALDSVPFVGLTLAAIAAAGLVADITETSVGAAASPWTFADELSFSHDIEVTISHDPHDYEFPANANYYELTALFDKGTPVTSSRIRMPAGTVTEPLKYTFKGVPYGGNVHISVGFYSDTDDWLAGQGSTQGSIPNDVNEVAFAIKEFKVPITINTQYSHKEKIVLDDKGNHIWEATTTPPSETSGDLSCENTEELCNLIGITVSEHFGAVGYSWKSYSSGVGSCASGGHGQLNQFASISVTQNPESGYLGPTCGYSPPVRVVYDLMSSNDNNYYLDPTGGKLIVRKIRLELDGKPSIDGPDSNISWGRLNNTSDAFLLHPSKKLVSINAEFDKIEILDLPLSSAPDDDAPLAQAHSGTGIREGLVNGPVAAAISPKGTILILESANQRIQAFDVGANPAPYFTGGNYHVPLKEEAYAVTYLDMAIEYTGYIYVLSYVQGTYEYRLDIYTPDGDFLTRTTGVNAARLTVDFWRNVYTLNYELLKLPNGSVPSVTEPSTSLWIPSVP